MKPNQRKEIRHEVWELYGGEWAYATEFATAREARKFVRDFRAKYDEQSCFYSYVKITCEREVYSDRQSK